MPKPPLSLATTTLWDYPSQNYGQDGAQGNQAYAGATPSYVIWNLLKRYTRSGDTVLDPMAGSGTTLDVCRDLGRKGVGFDLQPSHPEVRESDARHMPLDNSSVDFIFVDPPYSDHLRYSGKPECIGELSAESDDYYRELAKVFREFHRVLKPGRYLGLYVCDSFQKGKPYIPIGYNLFSLLAERFIPVEHVAVVRHHGSLKRNHWHTSAIEGNYFLRGFNHLFVFLKDSPVVKSKGRSASQGPLALPDRRDPEETKHSLDERQPRHTATQPPPHRRADAPPPRHRQDPRPRHGQRRHFRPREDEGKG